jgi:calcium-dependent protein kinase
MMRKGDGGVGRSRTMRSNLNFNLADAFGVKETNRDTN